MSKNTFTIAVIIMVFHISVRADLAADKDSEIYSNNVAELISFASNLQYDISNVANHISLASNIFSDTFSSNVIAFNSLASNIYSETSGNKIVSLESLAAKIISDVISNNVNMLVSHFSSTANVNPEKAKDFCARVKQMFGPLTLTTNQVPGSIVRFSYTLGVDHPGKILVYEIHLQSLKADNCMLAIEIPFGQKRPTQIEIAGQSWKKKTQQTTTADGGE